MKVVYLIWKEVDSNIRNDAEVVGAFVGDYREADEIVRQLNEGEGSGRNPYYRTEPAEITKHNVGMFLPY